MGGLVDVEGGADGGGGVGDDGQPPAGAGGLGGGAVLLGDVHDGGGQPQHPAVGVLQPVVRHRPGPVRVGVGGGAADGELVEQRCPGVEDLAHPGHDGAGVQEGQGLPDVTADVLVGGQLVDALQRRVDHDEAQRGVQDRQADRRLGDQAHRQRQIPLDPPQHGLVGGDAQGVGLAALVQQPHIAEFDEPGAAVLVPDREDPRPALAARHDLRRTDPAPDRSAPVRPAAARRAGPAPPPRSSRTAARPAGSTG